ncbi:hypothetical protein FJY93_03205 [Candidatus Kaiserbacteria bacterium]|nr:hypothetical protein [Candidatus Kaiserbacteria bacterium]
MEQIAINKEELKAILSANDNLPSEIRGWAVSYNKTADMFIAGRDFPLGSFYFSVDEGVMLRVDENKKIYGFAIENAKSFVKNNPQFALPFSIVMHPIRFYIFTLPTLFVFYHVAIGIVKMRSILSISDYIAGKAAFC